MKILQSIQRFINPQFMRNADHFLLLNYPRVWSSRIHYVTYYGIFANLILNILVLLLLQPDQIDEFIRIIIVIVMVAEAGMFIFWMVKQSEFNLEQDYGNINLIGGVIEIVLYSVCILIIISSSLTMTYVAFHKTAHVINFNQDNYELYSEDKKYLDNLLDTVREKTDYPSELESIIMDQKIKENLKSICKKRETTYYHELLSDNERKEVLNDINTGGNKLLSKLEKKDYNELEPYDRVNGSAALLIKSGIAQECILVILTTYYDKSNFGYTLFDISSQINHYLTNDFSQMTDYLYYDAQYWFHIVFFVIGLLFLIFKKYGSWMTVVWLSLYILLLMIVFGFINIVLNNFEADFFEFLEIFYYQPDDYDYQTNNLIATLLLIALISLYFYRKLIVGKQYNKILYLHFATLPIVIAILVFTFANLYDTDEHTMKESARVLTRFLLVYGALFPIQKRILTRFISLPKD